MRSIQVLIDTLISRRADMREYLAENTGDENLDQEAMTRCKNYFVAFNYRSRLCFMLIYFEVLNRHQFFDI